MSNTIKRQIGRILFFGFCIGVAHKSIAQPLPIIPKPANYNRAKGEFMLTEKSAIVSADPQALKVAYYFQNEILKYKGITIGILPKSQSTQVKFSMVASKAMKGNSYRLSMTPEKVEIQAADQEGMFLGAVSLLQLIRQSPASAQKIQLDNWVVEDQPAYKWRGLMLDESRHFFGKEKVLQLLDWMAFYKLNKFHWHLTDQHGWRIEIKKYPRLTLVGGIGNYSDPTAPAAYYTQQDIRDIIAYAAERFIEVIPEIDMPGHASAANLAYPEFSGGGSEKYPEFTFNPGKESTYQYLTNILKEVNVLFPSQKIHIGADEVHFGNQQWNSDPYVQKLMKDNSFKDLRQAEFYFVKRMADSVIKMDNEMLAWDEIVSSQVPIDRTTVLWWRHDKPEILKEALNKGFKVVLCPRLPLYFDFVQDSTHTVGRKWSGSYVPLRSVYEFPSDAITSIPNSGALIQGLQANLWTESMAGQEQIDYMLFPRIAALSETAWTKKPAKDFTNFQSRLQRHMKLYRADGLYFYNPFNPGSSPEWLMPGQRKGLIPDTEGLTREEK